METIKQQKILLERLRKLQTDIEARHESGEGITKKQKDELTNLQNKLAALEYAEQHKEELHFKERIASVRAMEAELQEKAMARAQVLEAKRNRFVTPKNAAEADGGLPSLADLVNSTTKGHYMTKEYILTSGTLLEKLRLYICSRDLQSYFGSSDKLTTEEEVKIEKAIKTAADRKMANRCFNEYAILKEYGEKMRFYFKRFQATLAMLAVSLNKWDGYERTAEQITFLFNNKPGEPVIDIIDADKYPYEQAFVRLEDVANFYSQEKVQAFLDKHNINFDGATLQVAKHDLKLEVNVFGEGGLYEQIKQEASEATEDLKDFKAFTDAIQGFLDKTMLQYVPISIHTAIESATSERYARYLVKNLAFFRSELNIRKQLGEHITEEEELKAVIPDFYEVEASNEVYNSCKILIKQLKDSFK